MDPNRRASRSRTTTVVYVALCVVTFVVVAALHNFGRRPASPPPAAHAVTPSALQRPPDVVLACPPAQNCLQTTTVPNGFVESITAAFPGLTITSSASVYDARIPEVDEVQVVGEAAAHRMIFTLERNPDAASPSTSAQARTRLTNGDVLYAALRGAWIVSVLGPDAGGSETPEAVSTWIRSVPLPR